MANNAVAVVGNGPERAKQPLTLIGVHLQVSATLGGVPTKDFTVPKYTVVVDERGDVRITDRQGNQLFVPKQLAILEYAARGA